MSLNIFKGPITQWKVPDLMKIFSLSQVRLYLAEIRNDLLRNSLKNAETELIYHGKFKVKEFWGFVIFPSPHPLLIKTHQMLLHLYFENSLNEIYAQLEKFRSCFITGVLYRTDLHLFQPSDFQNWRLTWGIASTLLWIHFARAGWEAWSGKPSVRISC